MCSYVSPPQTLILVYLEDVPIFESISEMKWNDTDQKSLNIWKNGKYSQNHKNWWLVAGRWRRCAPYTLARILLCTPRLWLGKLTNITVFEFGGRKVAMWFEKINKNALLSLLPTDKIIKMIRQGIDNSVHSGQRPQRLMFTVSYIFHIGSE